ncbi:MAG: serine racemase VanT catalytic subunit [Oscillospiraceae bacterium]|nr:serine racemase VanT catalytic subunit [Oscillospiraceae bacterium]
MTSIGLNPADDGRAWVEIDMSALRHNVSTIKGRLAPGCEIMAVVKADAYGHGAAEISSQLRQAGVNTFAVATVGEAIQLRESGLDSEILVMGCTSPQDAGLLAEHNLKQVVADGKHAKLLNETGSKLAIHIAIDTGMHRLGIEPDNMAEIEGIFACENLKVEGLATHFAAPDSLDESDIAFTRAQYDKFMDTVNALKGKGYNVGKLHMQSSYAVLNYPDFKCDFIRPGISLYGALHNASTAKNPGLRPVLSLRARVAQVRWIKPGESVSYGRTFSTTRPMKIATVSIGYADGVPRQISGTGAQVLIHSQRALIIGRICMDMLMLDVTHIDHVGPLDIVTLIGRDVADEIRCEEFAMRADTITHDVLCRLGQRLPRIYLP